jgi:hypothetical protein
MAGIVDTPNLHTLFPIKLGSYAFSYDAAVKNTSPQLNTFYLVRDWEIVQWNVLMCNKRRFPQNSNILITQTVVCFVTMQYTHVDIHFFFGAFATLRKATISFVMSVRPHGTPRFPLD